MRATLCTEVSYLGETERLLIMIISITVVG